MKILMVTMKMEIGGAETHILELCRQLKAMGHEVTLASNGGVYADMLVADGITHVKLPLDRKDPPAVAESMAGLRRLVTTGNFDIVHAHARIPAFLCGLLWRRYKFRFVTTAHLNFSINALWRRLSNWGERSMAVSDDIGDYLVEEYGYPREKISVTINGIDTAKYSPETDCGDFLREFGLAKEGRNRLVYVSRLDADRADPAYRIMNIAARLNEAVPNLDIILGGGGTEFKKLHGMAEEINKKAGRNLVTMTDNRSDVHRIMSSAHVFVGVSRSVLEAMATGVPVIIAGNQGALGILNEAVLPAAMNTNFCCRGYAQAGEEDLYRDITALFAEGEEERRARGEWCRSLVMEHYTDRRMAKDYVAMYESTLASPAPFNGRADVVVSGYYGFGNMGDETLLDRISESLAAEVPGVKIAALTRHPKQDSMKRGLRCIGRTDIFAIYRALRGAKLLISGGGTLFQDGTSKRSLWYYAGVAHLAERLGVKVYIYANGIGPITDEGNRRMVGAIVKAANKVSVRDPDSYRELLELGVDEERIEVTADPAFLTEPCPAARLQRVRENHGLLAPFFAVSLRRCEGRLAQLIDEERLSEEVAVACAAIGRERDLVPVFIPMQPQNDEEICRRTAQRVNQLLGRPSAVVVDLETASDFVGILSLSEFVIGMRLHMLIFSGCAKVPVIGLSYDPKIDSIMKRLEQLYILSVRNLTSADLLRSAEDILAHRPEIVRTVTLRAGEMREKCRVDVKNAASLLR